MLPLYFLYSTTCLSLSKLLTNVAYKKSVQNTLFAEFKYVLLTSMYSFCVSERV